MKILTIQPALPAYRHDFFQRVYDALGDRFRVAYSPTQLAGITPNKAPEPWMQEIGVLKPLGTGAEWQEGALSLPIEKGDVVVVCGAPRTISTLAVIVKARLAGAKVIWWGHFWSSTSKPWRFKLRMQMLKACHGVLFYTEAEVDEYRAMMKKLGAGDGSGPVMSGLNNGVDTTQIKTVRADYIAGERERSILFLGRRTTKAGLPLLLEALAAIPAATRPKLEVIGSGGDLESLRARTMELGLEGFVTWHGSIPDEADVAVIANRCRMFVYAGEVGLSLLHGMSFGLPAIVHSDRWRHMPEIAAFVDGVTGRSFAYGDAEGLAGAITDLMDDTDTLNAYSKAARERVEDTFNTKDMARRFVEMVRRIGDEGAVSGTPAAQEMEGQGEPS